MNELDSALALLVPYWQQLADEDSESREEYEREQIETARSEALEAKQ